MSSNSSTPLADDIARRIDRYRPTKVDRRETLGADGLELVREAVRTAEPRTLDEASRLLCHTADHVARSIEAGHRPDRKVIFGAVAVAESVADARARLGAKASPFIANLERVARAAAPKAGHAPPTQLRHAPVRAPYNEAELTAFSAAARGMPIDKRAPFLGALALGAGAGIVGPAASRVLPDHVDFPNDEDAIVWINDKPTSVLRRWVPVLRQALTNGAGPVTDIYTSNGRQRFERVAVRALDMPDLVGDKLRNTWLCTHLAGGTPIDVLADAAGVKPWSIASKHVCHISPPSADEVWTWLASHGDAMPPHRLRSSSPMVVALGEGAPPPANNAGLDGVLTRFRPADPRVRVAWNGPVGSDCRDLIRAMTHDSRRASRLAKAFSALLTWALERPDVAIELPVLLRDRTIERAVGFWATTGRSGSAPTYRSLLRALANAAGEAEPGTPTEQREHPAPYEDHETDRLLNGSTKLGAADRTMLDLLVVACLGTGARTPELTAPLDELLICRDGTPGLRLADRLMPISGVEPALDRLQRSDPTAWLRRSRRPEALTRASDALGLEVSPGRLRATWLTRHLLRGVPVPVLQIGAGTKIAEINHLIRVVPARPAADRLGWLATGQTLVPNR